MAKIITREQMQGLEPMQGSLNGSFEDCLDYLDWSINVFAGKGNMSSEKKGKAFADTIQILKERFGIEVSTHYLKQFCQKQKSKNLHITYMLGLANYKTEPIRTTFKGAVVNGIRCVVPKIFDMLVTKQDWEDKELRAQKFGIECAVEREAKCLELERQKLAVQKLQIVANLSDIPTELDYAEVEEVAPDLKVQDRVK